ncbi:MULTISPECIES: hypothetical protein [unclassified Bradyrhizobium]|uniref:hypothetical protein n=1 Tax=unclassified Bradyrhizobium TaxID=2631580 RepID=UPI001CD7D280|nr:MULTISPECIES: hypothetical protein [unclassified Bradyrhizobium]MCA1438510.1 hypothetical protein [Bradyrhizobium sp. BRP20]MCA1502175.1 hypothetical protein [Bradyrhizobium sp. NBAIM14]MCA1552503.1 hypothetical protein [Bradyrhizobium sp. BRP19]
MRRATSEMFAPSPHVQKEVPFAPLPNELGESKLTSIVDARSAFDGDDVELFGPERHVHRLQLSELRARRRLIEAALQSRATAATREHIARECLKRLQRASKLERPILAAWADASLRSLGFTDARDQIAKAAGVSVEQARVLIARGRAELQAAQREVGQWLSTKQRRGRTKPDLREIEVGSLFDGATSAHAIAALKSDAQHALLHAIENRFIDAGINDANAEAKSRRIRPLARGVLRALDELGRNDEANRDLLGRLDPNQAQRLVALLVSARADELDGRVGQSKAELTKLIN